MNLSTQTNFRSYMIAAMVFLTFVIANFQPLFASEQLVKKYQELAEKSGFTFTYGSLETHASDTFTLHDITLIRHGVEDPLKIKSIKMTGVNELFGIGLSAKNMALTGLSWDGRSKQGQEIVISLANASIDGFYLPDPKDVDAPLFIFDNYVSSMSNLSVLFDGNPVVEIPSLTSEFNGNGTENIFSGFVKISQLIFHPENIGDGGRAKQQLAMLGYDTLTVDINLEADWNMQTGSMSLSKYEFDIADMGVFDIQLAIGGYTKEFYQKIRALNAEIQSLPAQERDRASQRAYREMTSLTLESMKLSFRDNSITDKILAIQAEAQGQSSQNMKAMLPIMLNGMMAGLQQPALTSTLVSAVETFLADPGIISVSAKPEPPLAFSEITGLGVSIPNLLIEKLNITAQAQ